MFVFGHLGIGARIVKPFSRGLKLRWILLGTLLPDLIDKPIYYGLSWYHGLYSADLGLISGTRTFGHTAAFLLLLSAIAFLRKSRILAALSLGIASHLVLDLLGDFLLGPSGLGASGPFYQGEGNESVISAHSGDRPSTLNAILFPLLGADFPDHPFSSSKAHLLSFNRIGVWILEFLGLALLIWEYWKWRSRGMLKSKRS